VSEDVTPYIRPIACEKCGVEVKLDPKEAEALLALERHFPEFKEMRSGVLCERCGGKVKAE